LCPEQTKAAVRNSRGDEDCIVRPYLGRWHIPRRTPYFTLRNKSMYLDQLDGVGLPTDEYALVMADALAILYWHAKTDANDVEFVLTPPRADEDAFQSDFLGAHRVWLLDFDCVNHISF
jgi:hypothetical protein